MKEPWLYLETVSQLWYCIYHFNFSCTNLVLHRCCVKYKGLCVRSSLTGMTWYTTPVTVYIHCMSAFVVSVQIPGNGRCLKVSACSRQSVEEFFTTSKSKRAKSRKEHFISQVRSPVRFPHRWWDRLCVVHMAGEIACALSTSQVRSLVPLCAVYIADEIVWQCPHRTWDRLCADQCPRTSQLKSRFSIC